MPQGRSLQERSQQVRVHMRAYRSRMREQGLRPVQFWVPDTRSPTVAAEWRRQSLTLTNDPAEKDVMDWIEDLSDTDGWS